MYYVVTNQDYYRYEMNSLVKAFLPGENVKVYTTATEGVMPACVDDAAGITYEEAEVKNLLTEETRREIRNLVRAGFPMELYMGVWYGTDKIEVWFYHLQEDTTTPQYTVSKYVSAPTKGGIGRNKETLNLIRAFLYQSLKEETGKILPWGELIGIRPTKISMQYLEEAQAKAAQVRNLQDYISQKDLTEAGRLEQAAIAEAAKRMEVEHFVSPEKAILSAEIASREQRILSHIHYDQGYSLYIGIPFCPTTCLYCSFTSFPLGLWKERVDDYLRALIKEMEATAELMKEYVLDTIYIGGGTPTTLTAEQLDVLLSAINRIFSVENLQEFTVEAGRADSITHDKLAVMKRHEITRISVNPQTMKQETLDLIGRRHTVDQVVETFHMAREEGFDNINMDLILGLPEETEEDVERTIAAIEQLRPDSLTVHSLAIKRASKLAQWIEKNGISSLNNTDRCMEIAATGAAAMGMNPYYLYRQKNMSGNFENVGYATPGKEGIYNILIMEEKQSILALGAGSISKAVMGDGHIKRCDNCKDVDTYISNIDEMIQRKRTLWEN